MKATSPSPDAACDACTAAERNAMSGLARDKCQACWVRRVAQMPTWQRQEIYRGMHDDVQRVAFVAAVRAAYVRLKCTLLPVEDARG